MWDSVKALQKSRQIISVFPCQALQLVHHKKPSDWSGNATEWWKLEGTSGVILSSLPAQLQSSTAQHYVQMAFEYY